MILCMAPAVAHADKLDDFIAFYVKVENLAKDADVSLPFTSQQVKDAKTLVQCLDQAGNNDIQIALCIDTFQETPAGSAISDGAGIPSWVDDLLDCYIYYRTEDWWGLGYKLGEAVVCLVLQVVASGTDICKIIEELVELAHTVWNAANAIGQFLASVGEVAYDSLKDAGCAIGLGGCDDEPDSPPEAWVYSLVFANRLGEGLTARESIIDADFDILVSTLKQNALHKPEPILSVSPPPDVWGIQDAIYSNFTPGAVNKAAEIYTLNVNIQWTADIADKVLPARVQTLSAYASPQNLDYLAQLALSAYTPRTPWDPRQIIVKQCREDLRIKYKYAHVDRWFTIQPVSKRGPQAADIEPTVKSNYKLAEAFYDQVKNEITQRIRAHVIQQYCPDVGGKLVGHTIDKHRCCLELLKPFGQESQCYANTATCGKEARNAIIQEFKNKGTQFYGGVSFNPSSLVSQMVTYDPLEFLCYRPTHVYYFDFYYDKFYGDLPRKLLKSKLQEDSAYSKLKSDVSAAVNQLNSQYDYTAFGIDKVDPVMVEAGSYQDLDDVQKSANNFSFGPPSAKPGFEFSQGPRNINIDGRTTPLLYFDAMSSFKKPLIKMKKPLNQDDLKFKDPSGPITNPEFRTETMIPEVTQKTPDQLQQLSPRLKAAPKEVAGAGGAQPMIGSLPEGQTPKTGTGKIQMPVQVKKLTPEVEIPMVEVKTGETTQPMSGSLPTGKMPEAAPEIKQAPAPMAVAAKPITVPVPLVLPDLMAEPQIAVNSIRTDWGKTVEFTSETLPLALSLEFTVKNSGKGTSAGFAVNCVSARKMLFQKNVNPMGPGEMRGISAAVELEAGNHVLVVTVDSGGAVPESNEGNNRYEIRLNVSEKIKMDLQKRISPAPTVKPTLPARGR